MIELREELNLGGVWKLVIDPENRGVREGWAQRPPESEALEVETPGVWDVYLPDYDGVAWYFREVELPASWESSHWELNFGAVNYYAECWLNGKHLGAHEGGYTPFSFSMDEAVQPGMNQLAVRVVDPKGPEGFGHFKPEELPISKEMGYWSFAGIWGAVTMRRMPQQPIEDIFIQPDLRRKRAAVWVSVPALPEDARIVLQVEGTEYGCEGAPGTLLLNMPGFTAWRPEQPHLYRLCAEIRRGDDILDRMTVRFGMREFTVNENRFYLNFRPIFLKGVLYQPDYARSLAAPESEEMARREILLSLEAGFNLLRVHIKPAPPVLLELADELGMLIYEEPSIGWIKQSEYMRERCETSVREMILRDRNHPSIVIWGMLNETGNAQYVTNGGAQTIKDDLCRLARSLDPTRLIIDDSAGVNATREPSRMMRPFREELEPYDDLHIYQRAPVDPLIRSYYMNSGEPKQLSIISEFGFGGPEDLDDVLKQYGDNADRYKDARFLRRALDDFNRGFSERGLDKVFGDFSGFARAAQELQCDAARGHINAMRANPKLGGYCYTQLSDAGHEFCAGFLDRWRRPKPVMKTLAEVQQPLRPIIQMQATNLALREEVSVKVALVNEDNLAETVDLSLQVVGPTNQVLWKKKRAIKLPKNKQELWRGHISASGAPGPHRFVVRLMQGLKMLSQTEEEFHVYDAAPPSEVHVHILDPFAAYTEPIARLAHPDTLLAPLHIVPPLANTIRAYPDNDLLQVLTQVKGGAIAIFFSPPDDWNELAELLNADVKATPKDSVGAFLPVCHYVKIHPVFDKLPSRGLMRQPYCNVAPNKTFLEMSDEDICGSFDAMPIASGNYMMGNTPWWGSDILVRRYGSGRLVFTHLRILQHLGKDPVADRLFVNLVNHFGRRSVPPGQPLPPDQKSVEWLRTQRNYHVRRWMILGEFPNWNNNSGFSIVYPPEKVLDFNAVYEGWYQAAEWRRWYSRAQEDHGVDLQAALEPVFEYYPKFDRSVAYAYAEIACERRIETEMRIGIQDAMKVWLNGAPVFETTRQVPHDQFETETIPVSLRQGKNTLLVKCAKIPGPFKFSINFTEADPAMKWWK